MQRNSKFSTARQVKTGKLSKEIDDAGIRTGVNPPQIMAVIEVTDITIKHVKYQMITTK